MYHRNGDFSRENAGEREKFWKDFGVFVWGFPKNEQGEGEWHKNGLSKSIPFDSPLNCAYYIAISLSWQYILSDFCCNYHFLPFKHLG